MEYHYSIEMYTGLSLVICSVYWPIIGHLYCMTRASFFLPVFASYGYNHLCISIFHFHNFLMNKDGNIKIHKVNQSDKQTFQLLSDSHWKKIK